MKRFDGQTVTIDGLTKKIYLGDQALRAAKQEEIGIMYGLNIHARTLIDKTFSPCGFQYFQVRAAEHPQASRF